MTHTRRVLMVSPHFPPDTTAGAHRVRLLAPHLHSFGWEPTVLTVEPHAYEGRLDDGLLGLVPESLRVVRCRALSAGWSRRLGIGDLGLRALAHLHRAAVRLLGTEHFDALFITVYPTYPALLGPPLKRRFGVRFVLDYQDPWVGAWGDTVGPARDGTPDLKSRLTRFLATRLEPRAVRGADALTAVSEGTLDAVFARNPAARHLPWRELPLGGEPADFARIGRTEQRNRFFDPADGDVHLCYTGTLLPLGFETLAAVLGAVRLLRDRRPELYARLRLHFFGTGNQTALSTPARVLPVAQELGVAERVTEVPYRIDYLDALTVQTQASALLLMGSTERHYTASKLYPALLARRPILAAYHRASSVVDILRSSATPESVRLVTYDDVERASACTEEICGHLIELLDGEVSAVAEPDMHALDACSARSMAGRLAGLLDELVPATRAGAVRRPVASAG